MLGYWVEYRKSIESTWKKCNKDRLKQMEFTMRGLAEATEYEFRVFAENETGMSRPRRTVTCIKTKLSGECPEPRCESNVLAFTQRVLTD